jgi:hypothetical protein
MITLECGDFSIGSGSRCVVREYQVQLGKFRTEGATNSDLKTGTNCDCFERTNRSCFGIQYKRLDAEEMTLVSAPYDPPTIVLIC